MKTICSRQLALSRNQRGAEIVELALILPLFLALLIGIIEFGRAYNIHQNVVHATREGVRAAVADCLTGGDCTPGSAAVLSDTQIRDKIRAHLQSINIDVQNPASDIVISNTNITVNGFADANNPSYSQNIRAFSVRVNYTYKFLFLGPVMKLVVAGSGVGSGGVVMSATVEMRDERSLV